MFTWIYYLICWIKRNFSKEPDRVTEATLRNIRYYEGKSGSE